MYVLRDELWLPQPVEAVFPFFTEVRNLELLTPPWVRFNVLTPAGTAMRPGLLIDYTLRLHGVPMRWQSEITAVEPPHRFVDEQRRGPYRSWVHTHTFEPRDGGTLARDRVEYSALGGALVHRLFVKPELDRIFAYRRRVLEIIFS